MPSFDFYAEYKRWHESFYSRPFAITREEWAVWCAAPSSPAPISDIEWDHAREAEGDAQ